MAVKCVTAVGCNAMQGGKGATGGRQPKKECYARGGQAATLSLKSVARLC